MNVLLICPGLFGLAGLVPGDVPPTPALDRLLARADREESSPRDPLETLAAEFGVSPRPEGDLPSAALALSAEARDLAGRGYWFHADPVHLRADRDQLLLFGGPSLGLTRDQSTALVGAFNAHFGADGLDLVRTDAGHWYLRTAQVPDLRTQPLYRVSGRPVAAFAAQGADARALDRWQNEAQMLFYSHRVNQDRESAGQPAISGVWTWGGGTLPPVREGPDLTLADHPLAVGLALALGGGLLRLDEFDQSRRPWPRPNAGSVLIFWDRLWWPALAMDQDAWCRALAEVEALVAGLSAELAAGPLRNLTLDDGEQWRFTLTSWGRRRFWRRSEGLRRWIRGVA